MRSREDKSRCAGTLTNGQRCQTYVREGLELCPKHEGQTRPWEWEVLMKAEERRRANALRRYKRRVDPGPPADLLEKV